MESTTSSWREVRLPAQLCESAEQLLKGTNFPTLEELLAFVLRELTAHSSAKFEEQERQMIEQRLRDLGYL
jgi:hypothetical protein